MEGVGMRGDSKDGNPFPVKRLKPFSGGGGGEGCFHGNASPIVP